MVSNGLQYELHCNSNKLGRYLAKTMQQHPLMWAELKVLQLKLWFLLQRALLPSWTISCSPKLATKLEKMILKFSPQLGGFVLNMAMNL